MAMPWQGAPLNGRPPKTVEDAFEWVSTHDPDRDEAETLTHLFSAFKMPQWFMWNERESVGGPAQHANYDKWKEKYKSTENKTWWDLGDSLLIYAPSVQGAHGPVPGDLIAWIKAQRETLERLEDYPIMDEILWSKYEWDHVLEQWNAWGRRDFKRDFVKELASPDDDEQVAIEDLLEEIPDAFFDEWIDRTFWDNRAPETDGWDVHFQMPHQNSMLNAARAYWGKYPEDRTYDALIAWMASTTPKDLWQTWWRAEVELADTAFTKWKTDAQGHKTRELRIKPSDLPAKARSLATHGGTLTVPYDEDLCENLYIECRWAPHAPPEAKENPLPAPPSAKPPKGKYWVWNSRAQGWDALVK